jgi:hypothetical protein
VAAAAAVLLAVAPVPRTVAVQAAPGAALTVLTNGRFSTEANGRGGAGGTGFAVVDEHWYGWGDPPPPHVRFFDELHRRGLDERLYAELQVPNAGDVVGPAFRAVGDARDFEACFRWEVRGASGEVLRGGTATASTCCA